MRLKSKMIRVAEEASLNKTRAVLILIGLGAFLHFILSPLDRPASVIFDEVHFGKFISSYCCSHERFFDIHPPHAKLAIAGAAKLSGYTGGFPFDRIGEAYGSVPIFSLRLFPALWGVLIPVAFLELVLLMGGSLTIAFFGGLVLALDNAFLLQTRVIALDGLLLLAILCTLIFYLESTRQTIRKRQVGFWILTGISAALAVGTKITGLVAPALVVGLMAVDFARSPRAAWLSTSKKSFWMLLAFSAVYLGGWKLHFSLLDKPGFGDRYYLTTGKFVKDVVKIHQVMLERNAAITTQHSNASRWWEWPTMNKAIYYWNSPESDIYFLGNPVVWWGISAAFAFVLLSLVFSRKVPSKWILFCIAGFLISYLPFVPVKRPLFLYHFMTPLLFALLTILLAVDQSAWQLVKTRKFFFLCLSLIVAGFVVMSPLTYGWSKNHLWGNWVMEHLPKTN